MKYQPFNRLKLAAEIGFGQNETPSITVAKTQLESMYGTDDATTIINNCDTYLYMEGMDIKTAHHISVRLNVPIEDVLYMPLGQIVMFRRGQRPVITQRYNILENELYQQVTKEYESTMEDQSR